MEKKITGIVVEGAINRENHQIFLELRITNRSPIGISDFAVKLNKNAFKLQPADLNVYISPVKK